MLTVLSFCSSIFESNAIARYVARMRRDTELTGVSFFESAQVDRYMMTQTICSTAITAV
jgi:glutathione S-transferase